CPAQSHLYLAGPGSSPLEGEGVYLKGQGIVYTVTMPPPADDPRPRGSRPTPQGLSDWERMRKQLRGEKPAAPGAAAESKQPSVADVVLKLLADNGHNFKHLGDTESITVVVTFRDFNAVLRSVYSRPGYAVGDVGIDGRVDLITTGPNGPRVLR